jgi:hypothetical protein
MQYKKDLPRRIGFDRNRKSKAEDNGELGKHCLRRLPRCVVAKGFGMEFGEELASQRIVVSMSKYKFKLTAAFRLTATART